MIGDYEVIGHKIAEMVGNIYENEIKVRDAEIERLRQQVAELRGALHKIATIDYRGPMPDGVSIAKRAIAKATGGE